MNSERIVVVPKQGARVLDPTNAEPIPAQGKEVERTTYWLRREREGDVTVKAVPAKKPNTKE